MDKLTLINNALVNTGNNRVNILHDSSDEYQVANTAFDRAIKVLTASHSWPFVMTSEKLVRAPDAENKSRTYPDNCFRLPPDTLHVKEIFLDKYPLTEYEIIGSLLSCDFADLIYAKIVRAPEDATWHPMAEEILTLMVEAGCLRGLNEDFKEAMNVDAKAEALLYTARPHLDQQNPGRNVYKSSIRAARRVRRV